ncbi:MAG: signal peptidase I [Candidatus Pacebacteria bacterium]|nr:signal peptidase I [Candidatus Paceibacterota bacterium]PIR60383.1 MAG: signal peptidase I [Candidatus Pacebacteria bacterium CG10_big_fil_rev_8_21_14_0_10_44_54]
MLTTLKVIWNFVFFAVLIVVIVFSVLTSFSERPDSKLPFRTFVVISGSMEPTIMTGDLLFVRTNRGFGLDSIITFKDPSSHTVTHRIIKTEQQANGSLEFITKGDNNEDPDQYTTPPKRVLGTYWFAIPKLGYLLVYIRSFMGITIILSLFAGWFVSDQVWQRLTKKA